MSDFTKQRQEERAVAFIQGVTATSARKQREEAASRLRHNKRAEQVQKRRNLGLQNGETIVVSSNLAERFQELQQLANVLRGNDPTALLEATGRFRKLLSIENNPPIQEVIELGVVPRLIDFLGAHDHPALQFEASWALTNIASGASSQTRYVLDKGAVPKFRDLLKSPHDDVREQAIWALGNIAGDSPACRDFVLSHDVMEPLLMNLEKASRTSMARNATWTLSNLCRGKPQPLWELVSPALPTLSNLLYSVDEEVLTDACWTLSYLSDGPNERIQAVLEVGLARRLVELLIHKSTNVQTPALRTIGNIVTGDDVQTQIVVNVSVLPCLSALLGSLRKGIRKEACWTISNITAGSRPQIQSVIDARIFPKLIELLRTSDADIKKEAAWAISNAFSGGSSEQVKAIVELGAIAPLVDLLIVNDVRILTVGLEALENLLKIGDKDARSTGVNTYAKPIEEKGGVSRIEQLQRHPSTEIYEKALNIIVTYYGGSDDDDEGVAPQVSADAFNFGIGGGGAFNSGGSERFKF